MHRYHRRRTGVKFQPLVRSLSNVVVVMVIDVRPIAANPVDSLEQENNGKDDKNYDGDELEVGDSVIY